MTASAVPTSTSALAAPAASAAAPASTPAPAAPAGVTAGPANFDWNSAGLSAEHLQYVQTKGYKNPADVVVARIAAEKIIGARSGRDMKLLD